MVIIKKKVTSTDVARLAGVSQTTVSLILNGADERFPTSTIERVKSAVQTLGYVHTPRADKHRRDGRDTIAIFSSSLPNPYYVELITSIEQACERCGYLSLVVNTYRDAELERQYAALSAKLKVDGVVFTYMPIALDAVKRLSESIPVVVVGDKADSVSLDAVEFNSTEAGRLVANHLLELGHRQIAFISTPLNTGNVARVRRLEGLRSVLAEQGVERGLVLKVNPREPDYRRAALSSERDIGALYTEKILKEYPDITAFVGINDMIALGILDALRGKGLDVPGRYSVCGFDNIDISRLNGIALTTVDYFSEVRGRDALEILISKRNRLADTARKSIYTMMSEPQLIVRSTTGPACAQKSPAGAF